MKYLEPQEETAMHISRRYLAGEAIESSVLEARPLKSDRIEEIFRRVKRRMKE